MLLLPQPTAMITATFVGYPRYTATKQFTFPFIAK